MRREHASRERGSGCEAGNGARKACAMSTRHISFAQTTMRERAKNARDEHCAHPGQTCSAHRLAVTSRSFDTDGVTNAHAVAAVVLVSRMRLAFAGGAWRRTVAMAPFTRRRHPTILAPRRGALVVHTKWPRRSCGLFSILPPTGAARVPRPAPCNLT